MRDLLPSLWLLTMIMLVVGALVWLLPAQVEPAPDQPCVTIALETRGLPQCDGARDGSADL